jgi:hypothetical protein
VDTSDDSPTRPDFTDWPVPVRTVAHFGRLTWIYSPEPGGYSVDDFERIPDNRAELWNGKIIIRPDLTTEQQRVMSDLYANLYKRCPNWFRPSYSQQGIRIGPATIFRPDIQVLSRRVDNHRVLVIDALPDRNNPQHWHELWTKQSGYRDAGIYSHWVVDPDSLSVAVYELSYTERGRLDCRDVCQEGQWKHWGLWSDMALFQHYQPEEVDVRVSRRYDVGDSRRY